MIPPSGLRRGMNRQAMQQAAQRTRRLLCMVPNDEVGRRAVAQASNEDALSQSSIHHPQAHRRYYPRSLGAARIDMIKAED